MINNIKEKLIYLVETNKGILNLENKLDNLVKSKQQVIKQYNNYYNSNDIEKDINDIIETIKSTRHTFSKLGDELLKNINNLDVSEKDIYNIPRVSIDNIIMDILKHKDNLDEKMVIILNFEDVIATPIYDAYISGAIKYNPNKDINDIVFGKNVSFLSDISMRSHVYILTRNITACQNYINKIDHICSINILEITKSKIEIVNNICNTYKPKYVYYVDKNKDSLVEVYNYLNKLNIKCSVIQTELIKDMIDNIFLKLGQIEGSKLISTRQQEYISNIV